MRKVKYNLLNTPAKNKWNRIGTHRRSGVVIPLFSIYSNQSAGVGEIPDIRYIVDWCKETGMSIIQLLPLNEIGPDRAPYNAISTFALEPIYLRLNELIGVDIKKLENEVETLKQKFPKKNSGVNYEIKTEKLKVLWKVFHDSFTEENNYYQKFIGRNEYWLRDYALFKILSELQGTPEWDKWEKRFSLYDEKELEEIFSENIRKIKFHYWLQWQLYEQIKDVKKYANDNGVMIMGDLPFLVSRCSADVWSHQNYFKMNLAAGAPPDMYFGEGQLWGMPPYDWEAIAKDKYVYLKFRLQYAQNFYDLYRIDHFIGLFRVWTVKLTDNINVIALHGKFDPEHESQWEKHGKRIIDRMLSFSSMLPCAEDLGTVPECSYKTLNEYGIPGTDFQRYLKDENYDFISTTKYRLNSASVISTHDSTLFANWWNYEAGTVDGKLFEHLSRTKGIKGKRLKIIKHKLFDRKKSAYNRLLWKPYVRNESMLLKILGLRREEAEEIISLYKSSFNERRKFMKFLFNSSDKKISSASPSFIKHCLEKISRSASVFNIQLIQEYLSLDEKLLKKINKWNYRINSPGIVSDKNWSVRLPIAVDKLSKLKINGLMNEINKQSGRIAGL